jgi:predicted N-acyltransferase
LVDAAIDLAEGNGLSSLHITFCTEDEAQDLEGHRGLLHRITQQFHFQNRGYGTFDDFLADLSSRKRKNIRKEREVAASHGLTIRALTGNDIAPEHWDAFWQFYQDTGARKWGQPYLERSFFSLIGETMGDQLLLYMAERDGKPIAGALNFIGQEALFGRYWGCSQDVPFLHFELCYYQAIETAIALGLQRVEAGAQGEHKLARGYVATPTWSAHYLPDPGFRSAVADFLRREQAAVERQIAFLDEVTPFKKIG